MPSEKAIEEKVRRWAKGKGCEFIKFTPRGEVGWPDRIVVTPTGVHLWIEFKKPGKKPEPIQAYRMHLLQNCGANTAWFDNAKEAIEYINTYI